MKDKTIEISYGTILKAEFIAATLIACLLAAPLTKDRKYLAY